MTVNARTRFRRAIPLCLALLLLPLAAGTTPDGQMTLGLHTTPLAAWLDPAYTVAGTPFIALYALHDALLKPMPNAPSAPSLAESWTVSKDGLAYEFRLRAGARFHNGDPVTADDVRFSFQRYRGVASTLFKEKVRDVEVVDARRVRFRLREPWPDFLVFYGTTASGAGWIVPKRYVERVGDDGFLKSPIGAGPYRLVSFTPGVEMVFEAFDGYWRKPPGVRRLVLKSLPDESTRVAALKTGEVDVAYGLSGSVALDVRRTAGLQLQTAHGGGVWFVEFLDQWDRASPWHDRRVRLAANHAIDRRAINDAESLGLAALTGNVIPRSFEFSIPLAPRPFDRGRARALLAEAGYPEGFDAGDFNTWDAAHSLGEAIASDLAASGIRTRLRMRERAAFFTAWRERRLRGLAIGVNSSAGNAATRLEMHATKSGVYPYGTLPEVEDLFVQQGRESDVKRRTELLHRMQTILYEHVQHAPIYGAAFLTGVGPRVEESGIGLITGYGFSAPYEDVRLKR